MQAMSNNGEESGNAWSCVRNNGNNAWYVNFGNGNCNNNNTNNRYSVWPASEFDKIVDDWLQAERECYKNKHSSFEAARYHYHLSNIYDLVERVKNNYKPTTSTCFVLQYPVYREVFAANYTDRIVHHYIAPMISTVSESVHRINGNVSHGNRTGYSSSTAVMQIYNNIKEMSNGYRYSCYVSTMDVSGFFMSIDKEVAYNIFRYYSDLYYKVSDRHDKLMILKKLMKHNPTEDCIRKSPIRLWDNVQKEKSLFGAGYGKGLPIGNFYSQLIANILMSAVDERITSIDGLKYTRFVDDICIVAKTPEEIVEARYILYDTLNDFKLLLHPKKFYIQPYWHGVKFCGKVVKCNRIYISNRTVGAITEKIRIYSKNPSLDTAKHLMQSINSYFGLMKNTASFNIRKRIMGMALDSFSEWLYFVKKGEVYICRIKAKYNPVKTSIRNANRFIKKHNGKNRYIRKSKNRRK